MIETSDSQNSKPGMPSVGGLLGRFMLEKEIGQGSLGSVYLAHDTLLDVRVALKVISPALAKTEAFSRLAREVLLARKVSHPGICQIFDIHEVNQYLFISMEYIEGPTLEELITHNGVMPVDRAARIVAYIARSLAAAHAQGVIHRGLTPSNLVVKPQDRASIMDFGQALARDLAGDTAVASYEQDLVFMSPEILLGKQATQACDIYSLGAILYRCVTGAYPFQGDNVESIHDAVLSGNIIKPHLFNPQVGRGLENLIIKSMKVRPGDRFHSVIEFKQWLTEATGEDAASEQSVSVTADSKILRAGSEQIDIGSGDEFDPVDEHTQQVLMEDKTILFSDIVAITKFFDKFGDMAGRKRIQKHNQLLFPVIQRHRGKVIKTIGDAIMAYFVLPDDAVEASIDMQQELEKQNSTLVDEDSQTHIRIGLHSGPCIVEDQDVFGDAVNVASRVCGQTGGNEILISAETRSQLVRNKENTEFFSDTMLKGKSEEYSLYSVSWKGLNLPDSLLPLADPQMKSLKGSASSPLSVFSAPPTTSAASQESGSAQDYSFSDPPDLSFSGQSEPVELHPEPLPPSGPVQSPKPALYIPDTEDSVEFVVDEDLSRPQYGSPAISASMELPDTTALVNRTSKQTKTSTKRPLILLSTVILLLALAFFSIKYWPGTDGNTKQSINPLDGHLRSKDDLLSEGASGNKPAKTAGEGIRATSLSLSGDQADKNAKASNDSDDVALVPLLNSDKGSKVSGKKHGHRSTIASAAEVRRLKKSIRAAMRKKGLIAGDCRNVDSDLRQLRYFAKKKNYSQAILAAHKARAKISTQKIDRKFIQSKLLRFNKAFDKVSDSPEAQKVMEVAQDIMSAVESGKYERANSLLNRSFRIIRSVK